MTLTLLAGLLVIAAAVYAVVRKIDVRLALLIGALLLGALAGKPEVIAQKFFLTLVGPEYVIPICSAMGFAYVLRHTVCDQHLVHLLTEPLRRARVFLIPGAVLVGFVVNVPIISQSSAAVAIGSVLIPLLLAARVSRVTAGAALLLGASLGGELLNPGAPEYRTVIREAAAAGLPALTGAACVQSTLPLVLVHLAVATLVFWAVSLRAERTPQSAQADFAAHSPGFESGTVPGPVFKVNLLKAAVPLIPLGILFLTAPPFELVKVPREWLVGAADPSVLLREAGKKLGDAKLGGALPDPFDSRLIGAAMLVGTAVAALTDRHKALGTAKAFFEGAGFAFTNVISLIVVAACFGEGVKLIGLDKPVQAATHAAPALLLPAAGFLPLGFSFICGSGIASTQSLFPFFIGPAVAASLPVVMLGSVVSLGAAAGRTMSPVAAVVLMSSSLTETSPTELVRRVAGPLLAGMAAAVLTAALLRAAGVL